MKFWHDVAKAKADVRIQSQSGAWFRGVKKGSYKLIPSLLRNGLASNEHNLIARFVRQGSRYLKTIDPWERLAFMQHYGVPTKLLDWTTDVTSAIYFAVAYNAKSKACLEDPSIWILNPFRLNGLAEEKRTGSEPKPRKVFDSMDTPPEFVPTGRSGQKWLYEHPIAIALNWYDPRIENQQGVFTYHGTDTRPIEDVASECVRKITVTTHPSWAEPGNISHGG